MTLRLEALVEGPATAETLVFVQGWPDDATLWDDTVSSLSTRYRCVRTTLPNFDGRRSARWGYSTAEIVEALAEMIREVSPDRPVTLILHDWGCYWGHTLHQQNPELVARVAGLDVAPHVEPGAAATLGIVLYQSWLIAALAIGGRVGDWMTRVLAGALGAPMQRGQINCWMNYPYRNAWQDRANGRTHINNENYWPEVPILFVYGKDKPFPFHSKSWLEHIENTGGTAVGLDCGHWVPRDPELTAILADWLAAAPPPASGLR